MERQVTASAVRLIPQLALASCCLCIGALLLLLQLVAASPPADVAYAGTSGALYIALATSNASTVYLTGSVKLERKDWELAINITRNVTVAAPPQYQAIGVYMTLDCASIVAGIRVLPGSQVSFSWLEMVNYAEEVGQAMLLVSASPGGRVVFHNVVQRRLAGLGGKQTREELLMLPRLPGLAGDQTAFFLPRFCFNSSREGSPHCNNDLVFVVELATRLGPANSKYFADGVPLGEYEMIMVQSVQISDVAVDINCLPGASVWECVVRQLRLLAIQPVLIKAKPSASNLVKIVASLAILGVAVLLFLYFRRHYRTYQERRARRMRRIKEALGMGREAHGIMFNGLDGEEPDWQIMPMPVGYAPDEGGSPELHQNSNIRNLIKDISTRPNRHIPDGATEVRVELETAPEAADICPIAAEVGLRRTPVLLLRDGASPRAAVEEETEDAGSPSLSTSRGSQEPGRGGGGTAIGMGVECRSAVAAGHGKEGSGRVLLPPEGGLKGGGDGGGAGGAGIGEITVQHIRPSCGSGTTGVSHRSTSVTSMSHTTLPVIGGLGPPPAATAATLSGVGAGAGGSGGAAVVVAAAAMAGVHSCSSSGGRGGSEGLELPSTMSVTKAGMEVLMASRVAARAGRSGCGTGPGSGGTAAGQAGSRSVGSRDSHPLRPHPEQLPEARAAAGSRDEVVDGGPGSGGGAGGGGVTAAAAARHAVTYAAADAAPRVMQSRDSDDEGQMKQQQQQQQPQEGGEEEGATRAAVNGAAVASLMDELEELRRDIMAGINDTQLQIMSVVGSGAFGTVYRGQWQGLEVAVKTVVFSASSENRKRALQEAALCQSINHRNIVATYAVDVQPLGAVNTPLLLSTATRNNANATLSNLLDWRLYIVQEFCDGGPLRKLVQSQYLQTSQGPNMPVICEVALELAQALAHLHSKNIIHGDLNPNNVLLKRDASSPIGFRVKMADFGLSVMVPLQKTHMSNLRLGTLYYIAPETCFRGQLGYAADVFSLGVMLWELYHGRLAGTRTPTGEPRYQPDFPDFPAACPVDYRKLAHRCLQKQPHNRLHSSQVVQRLQEMIHTFRAAAAAAPDRAPPPLPPLPLGGPDETALPPAAPTAAPIFAHKALTAAAAAGGASRATSGPGTPAESRHKPTTPTAAGMAAVAAVGGGGGGGGGAGPEIAPWQAAVDSPRVGARGVANGEGR